MQLPYWEDLAVKRSEHRRVENGNAASVEVGTRNQSGESGRQHFLFSNSLMKLKRKESCMGDLGILTKP